MIHRQAEDMSRCISRLYQIKTAAECYLSADRCWTLIASGDQRRMSGVVSFSFYENENIKSFVLPPSRRLCFWFGLLVCQQDYGKTNDLIFMKLLEGYSMGQRRKVNTFWEHIRITGWIHALFFTYGGGLCSLSALPVLNTMLDVSSQMIRR